MLTPSFWDLERTVPKVFLFLNILWTYSRAFEIKLCMDRIFTGKLYSFFFFFFTALQKVRFFVMFVNSFLFFRIMKVISLGEHSFCSPFILTQRQAGEVRCRTDRNWRKIALKQCCSNNVVNGVRASLLVCTGQCQWNSVSCISWGVDPFTTELSQPVAARGQKNRLVIYLPGWLFPNISKQF